MVCVLFMIFIHREPCDHSPRSVDVSQEIKGKNSRVLNPEKQQYIVEPPFITPIRTAHVVERTRKVDGHTTIEKRIHPYGA